MAMDSRLDRLEGVVEQMGHRLNSIESRLTSLENRMTNMWIATMGTMIAGFVTLFVAILLKN